MQHCDDRADRERPAGNQPDSLKRRKDGRHMVDFTGDSVFNLKKIDEKDIHKSVYALLITGEEILGGYRIVRDQVVFTTKRIITLDVQGVTGKKQDIFCIPYAKIQYFSVQTAGFGEMIPDGKLTLYFMDGNKMAFEFKDNCNILEIARMISQYTM